MSLPRVDGGILRKDSYGLYIDKGSDYTRPEVNKPRVYPERIVSTDYNKIEAEEMFNRVPKYQSGKGIFIIAFLVVLYLGFR